MRPDNVSIALLALVACTPARPPETPSAEPTTPPGPSSSAEPVPPKPSEPPADVTPAGLVQLVAKPKAWPMSAEAVERYLERLGKTRREQPAGKALTLIGGASRAVTRFEVSYTGGTDARAFTSASFYLTSDDLIALWHSYETLITTELGAPAWKRDNGAGEPPSAGWNLGGPMELLLAPSPHEGERGLVLTISEPEGEAE